MAMGSYFSKGMNYGRQGELGHDELHKEAEEHIQKSLKLDPSYYDAYFGLGIYEYFAGSAE